LAHRKKLAQDISLKFGVTTVLKGVIDVVSDKSGKLKTNATGNQGMTVGGTGDVLAGVIAGLMSQKMSGPDAGLLAVKKMGQSGDRLAKEKGFRFTAEEVARGLEF
jgi:NAD(P)H-hydrate epimerase